MPSSLEHRFFDPIDVAQRSFRCASQTLHYILHFATSLRAISVDDNPLKALNSYATYP